MPVHALKSRNRFPVVGILLALFATSAFASFETRLEERVLSRLTAPNAAGARLRLKNVRLDDKSVTLDLERFEAFAPNAEIVVYGADGRVMERLAAPNVQYYRGTVAGDAQSIVFIAISPNRAEGFVFGAEQRFSIGSRPRSSAAKGGAAFDLVIDEVSIADDIPTEGDGFNCEVENHRVSLPSLVSHGGSGKDLSADAALVTGTARWSLNLAIETDYELYLNSGSSVSNVNTFIGNLVGAASTIYLRDLQTTLQITYLGIHSSASDPFTVNPGSSGTWNGAATTYSTSHALAELGDRWHNSPPSVAPRSSTVLVSGKSQSAGVAWINTICDGDFLCSGTNCGNALFSGHYGGRYAYCGGIVPPGDLSVPNPNANANYAAPASNYWPLLQFTHELGHNVGSSHTHCIALSASDQTLYGRSHVDRCVSGSPCYAGATSVPAERGTIMSYCHLSGGSNTRFTFGQPNEASHVVPENMRSDIQGVTPPLSVVNLSASSFPVGGSGTASVTNVAGLTYSWTISNGTITSATNTSAITFTANANPVTVTVRATNSSGCSVSDYASASVSSSCSYSITPGGLLHAATPGTGSFSVQAAAGCTWTATESSPFVTITGGASGSGNGTVSYSLTANMGTVERSTTINVPGGQVYTVRQAPSPIKDFNADGQSDVLWWNSITGQLVIWYLNAGRYAGSAIVTTQDVNWRVVGTSDFDRDGYNDFVWRNGATGANLIWLMNGSTFRQEIALPNATTNWFIEGTGDVTGDGHPDILWHDHNTGVVVIWRMTGTSRTSGFQMGSSALPWHVAGVADFNADGNMDIFWRHLGNGQNAIWRLSGTTFVAGIQFNTVPDTNWRIAAIADYNNDGAPDLYWRNISNGLSEIWYVNNFAFAGALSLGSLPASPWEGSGPH